MEKRTDAHLDARYQIAHVATVHSRRHHAELARHPLVSKRLETTLSAPLRSSTCVAITCLLAQVYAVSIGEGEYVYRPNEHMMIFINDKVINNRAMDAIKERVLTHRPKHMCVNNALSDGSMRKGGECIRSLLSESDLAVDEHHQATKPEDGPLQVLFDRIAPQPCLESKSMKLSARAVQRRTLEKQIRKYREHRLKSQPERARAILNTYQTLSKSTSMKHAIEQQDILSALSTQQEQQKPLFDSHKFLKIPKFRRTIRHRHGRFYQRFASLLERKAREYYLSQLQDENRRLDMYGYCRRCKKHHPGWDDSCLMPYYDQPLEILHFFGAWKKNPNFPLKGHPTGSADRIARQLYYKSRFTLVSEYGTSRTCCYCSKPVRLLRVRREVNGKIIMKGINGALECMNPECPRRKAGRGTAMARDDCSGNGIRNRGVILCLKNHNIPLLAGDINHSVVCRRLVDNDDYFRLITPVQPQPSPKGKRPATSSPLENNFKGMDARSQKRSRKGTL